MLKNAVGQIAAWLATGHAVPVAVNISANNLLDPHFADKLRALLATTGVPARPENSPWENSAMASLSDVILQTPRLTLRLPVAADADAVFAMRSDPVVQRYGSHAPWTDRSEASAWIARCERGMAAGEHAQFAIERREDGAVVGTCVLYALDIPCRRAEVGYALVASEWGKGYANEAVTSLLDWGFDHLDLNRVEADIDPRNVPSARALERLGFVREGHLRERWIVAGEVSDSWLYGLLRAEWKARRAAA